MINYTPLNESNKIAKEVFEEMFEKRISPDKIVEDRGLTQVSDIKEIEILGEDMLFTKCGWVYHYNAIPNNVDSELTVYWMKKTYEYLYGKKVIDF